MLQLEKNLRFASMQQLSKVDLVELRRLRAHEEVDFNHLKELKKEIASDRILKFAVAVDKDTNIILDGHHRFSALKELGCKRIPAVFVDLNSLQIEVNSFRNDRKVTKEMVVNAGLSGNRFPPKTSKHIIRINGELKHILAIEQNVNLPLKNLQINLCSFSDSAG